MSNEFIASLIFAVFIGFTEKANSFPDSGAGPSHPHPYLMPPAEKQRLLERVQGSEIFRGQYERIKERADQGKFADAALVFALEGGENHLATVRNHLLQLVKYREPRLDEDIAAGGHREGNMDFYWDTVDIRAYDWYITGLPPKSDRPSKPSIISLGTTGRTA